MPIVPRRTRMVTKPQRIVILMLLNVLLICLPRENIVRALPLAVVVGKPPAAPPPLALF
ncbi:hypothetical protein NC651_028610 [Populus alba x Populus x berolinensis]|nr:hypothetical protein NC651_028610 [Populus alba x Populus x berolinensis]